MTDTDVRDGDGAQALPGALSDRPPGDARFAPLWLETIGRLAARAAHPIRNALNGAALNAEVVRSRTGRDGPAAALAAYAGSTAAQVGHAAASVGALLSFLRAEPAPADAAGIVRRLAELLREPSGGGTILDVDAPVPSPVDGPSDVARLVIVRTLLDCVPREAHVRCEIRGDDAILLVLLGAAVIDTPWDAPLAGLALASGIARAPAEHGVTVRLPRASRVSGAR